MTGQFYGVGVSLPASDDRHAVFYERGHQGSCQPEQCAQQQENGHDNCEIATSLVGDRSQPKGLLGEGMGHGT
jgi:hypothetical protein